MAYSKTGNDPASRAEEFMALSLANQRRIHSLIISLIRNETDAEDLLQETLAAMWRKFDAFEVGTDFASWGMRFARYIVLKHRERRRREGRVAFDDDLVRSQCEQPEALSGRLDPRQDALGRCVACLPVRFRSLLELRYVTGMSVREISRRLCQSEEAVYQSLSRVRRTLLERVNQAMAAEGN